MRLFIALPLPDDVRQALARAQAELKRLNLPLRPAGAEGLHLTLAFLGETGEHCVPDIHRAMDAATQETPALSLTAEGLGCFPTTRQPRVVWAGLGGDTAGVAVLQARLVTGLQESGFMLEDRPFRPHVTLGRAQGSRNRGDRHQPWSAGDVETLERVLSRPAERYGAWRADAIHLMGSELRREGARYTTLYTSTLG